MPSVRPATPLRADSARTLTHPLPVYSARSDEHSIGQDVRHQQRKEWRREVRLTYVTLAFTALAAVLYLVTAAGGALRDVESSAYWSFARLLLFIGIVLFLIYGNILYQFMRIGYFQRLIGHRRRTVQELHTDLAPSSAPPMVVLVPSYKEDPRIVRQTLLSAALQRYPNRRIVLLIDDPSPASNPEDDAILDAARSMPSWLAQFLAEPASLVRREHTRFLGRMASEAIALEDEARHLRRIREEIADWFAVRAASYGVSDHTDACFVEHVLRATERVYRRHLTRARDVEALVHEYAWLSSAFEPQVITFERRDYVNLSHEPNKAANLNSYIGLLGGRFRKVVHPQGMTLEEAGELPADLKVPDADYVLTLDADSLIAPDYALRLIAEMEAPGNERIAVAQTPYSAIPGATSRLERTAGATTDIQYLIHQGFTRYGATYWVGANAVLRTSALRDIQSVSSERGFAVQCFIHDRTVIEDTESTIDLVDRGWSLYNYPERLAYSATPPDFGSFLIQRRRWANGGLIILPKLLRYLAKGPDRSSRIGEGLARFHYLSSICGVTVGLLLLLFFPFGGQVMNWWLPLTAIPYFSLYARDLVRFGYARGDIVRVYALNLMLIPIQLAGVAKSLHQACTGRKIPFGRTPKVEGRTSAPAWSILAEYALAFLCLWGGTFDLLAGNGVHALFSYANGAMLGYALVAFLGARASLEDLRRQIVAPARRLRRPGLPERVTPIVRGDLPSDEARLSAERPARKRA